MDLKQHPENEVIFFVRNSSTLVEKGNNTHENTWENYQKGLADKAICRTISVSGFPLNLSVLKASYPFVQCIRVPNGYKQTIEEINKMLEVQTVREKTVQEKLQEFEKLQLEMEALKSELQTKNVITKKTK